MCSISLLELNLSSRLSHFSARQRWTYQCDPSSSSSVYEAFVKLAAFVALVNAARFVYLKSMLIDLRILKAMVHVTVSYTC